MLLYNDNAEIHSTHWISCHSSATKLNLPFMFCTNKCRNEAFGNTNKTRPSITSLRGEWDEIVKTLTDMTDVKAAFQKKHAAPIKHSWAILLLWYLTSTSRQTDFMKKEGKQTMATSCVRLRKLRVTLTHCCCIEIIYRPHRTLC